jgi:hypothetical protein
MGVFFLCGALASGAYTEEELSGAEYGIHLFREINSEFPNHDRRAEVEALPRSRTRTSCDIIDPRPVTLAPGKASECAEG